MKKLFDSSLKPAPDLPVVTAPDTFETIYNRYISDVYQKCLSMTHDSQIAQDYTQDIFVLVFSKMSSFQNRSSFSTWLYSVSHNYCIDQIRTHKRFPTQSLADEAITIADQQDQSALREARLQILEKVLNRLPTHELALLRLRYERNLSIKEIAQHFQLTESAVKMRLKRTIDKLNRLFPNLESD